MTNTQTATQGGLEIASSTADAARLAEKGKVHPLRVVMVDEGASCTVLNYSGIKPLRPTRPKPDSEGNPVRKIPLAFYDGKIRREDYADLGIQEIPKGATTVKAEITGYEDGLQVGLTFGGYHINRVK